MWYNTKGDNFPKRGLILTHLVKKSKVESFSQIHHFRETCCGYRFENVWIKAHISLQGLQVFVFFYFFVPIRHCIFPYCLWPNICGPEAYTEAISTMLEHCQPVKHWLLAQFHAPINRNGRITCVTVVCSCRMTSYSCYTWQPWIQAHAYCTTQEWAFPLRKGRGLLPW